MTRMRSRILAMLEVGVTWIRRRLFRGGCWQPAVTIIGVSLAIALPVIVTGVSVGLATETSVYRTDVDYWIVSESASTSTMAVSVGGPALGQTHAKGDRIANMDGVTAVSPVTIEMLRLEHSNNTEYVLVAGVVANEEIAVLGMDTSALTPGDLLDANGSYVGESTGEMLISPVTASLLNLTEGEQVTVARNASKSQ